MRTLTLVTLYSIFMLISAVAIAATSAIPTGKKNLPTNIKSGRMVYDADGQSVKFIGNVHINRPDFQLWSQTLTVFLKKTDTDRVTQEDNIANFGSAKIDRIVAEKDVIIKSDDKEARAQRATYIVQSSLFILEGSPWLKEKDKELRGKIIRHYMNDSKSIVEGAEISFGAPDKTIGKNNDEKKP